MILCTTELKYSSPASPGSRLNFPCFSIPAYFTFTFLALPSTLPAIIVYIIMIPPAPLLLLDDNDDSEAAFLSDPSGPVSLTGLPLPSRPWNSLAFCSDGDTDEEGGGGGGGGVGGGKAGFAPRVPGAPPGSCASGFFFTASQSPAPRLQRELSLTQYDMTGLKWSQLGAQEASRADLSL